jgi:drug/metabolite transporter (DMT)-like permease
MASTLMFIALTMVDASVYQMMRGIIVVITALLAVIFLGRKQYRHHWTAIAFIVFGVAEVGYVSIKSASSSGESSNEVFGIVLLLLSQCFAGTMFIVEEKLLGDYYLDPFIVVGTEGMWGLVYYLGLLPLMQIKTCGYGGGKLSALCNYGYLENSAYAFE